jgi:hypothetical protein
MSITLKNHVFQQFSRTKSTIKNYFSKHKARVTKEGQ